MTLSAHDSAMLIDDRISAHEEWIKDPEKGRRLMAFNEDFSGAGRSFTGRNLSGAILRYCNFSKLNLCHADFSGVDLCSSNFYGAHLNNASFAGANLKNVSFAYAELISADFRGSTFLTLAKDAHDRLIAVAKAALKPDALYMGDWHTCDTTHCIAGWAIYQAGELGRVMAAALGEHLAGMYLLGTEAALYFHAGDDEAQAYLCSVLSGERAAQGAQPRPYVVTMATGEEWELWAASATAAKTAALELSGQGSQVERCSQAGEWTD